MEIISKSYVDELGNLFFDVTYKDGDDIIEKRIPVETYLSLFDGNIREKENFVDIPKLSSNYLAARIGSVDKSSFSSLCCYKAEKRAFAIAGNFFRLPFPALLMGVIVKKGTRQKVSVFALDTDEPTDDTPVFYYPFGNVYEDGDVCMGNIVSTGITSVVDSEKIFDDFICGVTNEHLYGMRNKLGLTQLELVKHIENMEVYPKDLLVPAGFTVRDLKKKLNME